MPHVKLTQFPAFAELCQEQHAGLLSQMQTRSYSPEEVIFEKDDPAQSIFVVLSGEVEILRVEDDLLEKIAYLRPGDIFGELGALKEKPRNATAKAYLQTELCEIPRETLIELAKELPGLDCKVATAYLERKDPGVVKEG